MAIAEPVDTLDFDLSFNLSRFFEAPSEPDTGDDLVRTGTIYTGPKPVPGDWVVEGYATTADLGSDDAIITKEAQAKAIGDFKNRNTVLYNHNLDKPVARISAARAEPKGMWIQAVLSKSAGDIWNLVQEGIISKFSTRTKNRKSSFVQDDTTDREVLKISEIEVLEVSLVSVPAVHQAFMTNAYVQRAMKIWKGGDTEMATATKETVRTEPIPAEEAKKEEVTVDVAALAQKVDGIEASVQDIARSIGDLADGVRTIGETVSGLVEADAARSSQSEVTPPAVEATPQASTESTVSKELSDMKKSIGDMMKDFKRSMTSMAETVNRQSAPGISSRDGEATTPENGGPKAVFNSKEYTDLNAADKIRVLSDSLARSWFGHNG